MYVMNITFSNWQTFLKEEGWEEFIRQLLEQYEGLGPLPGIALPFLKLFTIFAAYCICTWKCCCLRLV